MPFKHLSDLPNTVASKKTQTTHTKVTTQNAAGCSYKIDEKQVSDLLKACTLCFDKWEASNNFVL